MNANWKEEMAEAIAKKKDLFKNTTFADFVKKDFFPDFLRKMPDNDLIALAINMDIDTNAILSKSNLEVK